MKTTRYAPWKNASTAPAPAIRDSTATEHLSDVMRLIRQEQYFAIHAARQLGKTTLLQGLARDINASGKRIALYFTVESVMAYPDPHDGIAKIVEGMRTDLPGHPIFDEIARNPAASSAAYSIWDC